MALFSRSIGIDLGTVNVIVAENNQIVLHEPSVVAISIADQQVIEIGQAARDMYGRAPETIEVMRPLREGVIADYDVTVSLLRYVLKKVCGPMRFFRPDVVITAPHGITSVENRAVEEAAYEAGAREVFVIPEPLAAALGAELQVATPTGNLVVVLGAGATQAAVVSMNGIVAAHTSRVGGLRLDDAIAGYIRRKYGLLIGETTSEDIKLKMGAAVVVEGEEQSMEIQGRDQVNGLPRTLTLTTADVVEALQEPLQQIVGTVRAVLEKTPPELAADVIDRGMLVCGGGAMLRGIDQLLTQETGIPAYVAENPMAVVALGTSRAFRHIETLRKVLPRR
jgi:rod shape-determining protein MreB and related proteins